MLYPIRNRSRIALCCARQVVGLVIGGEREPTPYGCRNSQRMRSRTSWLNLWTLDELELELLSLERRSRVSHLRSED